MTATERRRRRGRSTARVAVVLIVLGFVVLVALTFTFIAEERADYVCMSDPPGVARPVAGGVRVQWVWAPPGFECVFTERDADTGERRVVGVEHLGLWPEPIETGGGAG